VYLYFFIEMRYENDLMKMALVAAATAMKVVVLC
jgi:hypothetical protein